MGYVSPGLGLGLLSGTLLVGSMSTYSIAAAAILKAEGLAPGPAATVWSHMYSLGRASMPPLAVLSALGYGWAAAAAAASARVVVVGTATSLTTRRVLCGLAAASSLAIVPFTLVFMAPTNKALHQVAAAAPVGPRADAKVREQLARWTKLHTLRTALPAVGVVLGVCAAWLGGEGAVVY